MKTIFTIAAVAFCLTFGATAWATIPYPFVQSISMPGVEQVEASLYIMPDGSGPALSEAMVIGTGMLVDATISIQIITAEGTPIPNFPHEDVWLQTDNDQQYFCLGGSLADNPSDVNGEMTFSGALAGGGFNHSSIFVYVVGDPAYNPVDYPFYWAHPPVALSVNSPDINGDGTIDLVDIGLFATDFFNAYNYRSDFICNGVLDLADVGKMATGVGLSCQ